MGAPRLGWGRECLLRGIESAGIRRFGYIQAALPRVVPDSAAPLARARVAQHKEVGSVAGPQRSLGSRRLGRLFPTGLMARVPAPCRWRPPGPAAAPGAVLGLAIALAGSAILLGTFGTAAQTAPPASRPIASLKTVPVPVPPDLGDFVLDPTPGSPSMVAATQLGKALFWDMQVGSDGIQACASCHFTAGADNRTTNQVSPGLLATPPDTTFQIGGPNATLTAANFPVHQLLDPNNAQSAVIRDTNDIVGSQGVFRRDFVDATQPLLDRCVGVPDTDGFAVGGLNVRRVEPRNAPSVINAVFNFRNFWDGRAQNHFNGVSPFGDRDSGSVLLKSVGGVLQPVHVSIANASLASQAVGPPRSFFEMSCNGRAFPEIGERLLSPLLVPLAKQVVDPTDSVLGPLATSRLQPGGPGLQTSYAALIRQAFRPEWWANPAGRAMSAAFLTRDAGLSNDLRRVPSRAAPTSGEFTQLQANFSLFFGLAVQLYESTLVANDTPFDRFLEGTTAALTADQQAGLGLFSAQFGSGQARCDACHGGPELTNASVANVANERLERMHMGNDGIAVYDDGFYNTAVRPTGEDPGVGGSDPFGNPLAEVSFCEQNGVQNCPVPNQDANGQIQPSSIAALIAARPDEAIPAAPLQPQCPAGSVSSTATCDRIDVAGAFKTPGLRNVELTGPYFHNGDAATLRQVIDFYNRGGDFAQVNEDNLDPNIVPLGLSDTQKNQLVVFLLSLTDERVRLQRAPFDHPSLCVPNGHPGSSTSAAPDPRNPGQALDQLRCLPAVGAGGSAQPVQPFLSEDPFAP
jgi:cytochrome c peroxidase